MNKSFKQVSVFVGFALMAALLMINALITKHQLDRQRGTQEWVEYTRMVLFQLEQVESTLKDAETGQRGYLLTGDDRYLASYTSAMGEIRPMIDELARLTADNSIEQRNIAELREATNAKLNELAQTISLYRSGDSAQAMEVVRSDEGLLAMDKIRLILAQMRSEETVLEGARLNSYDRSQRATAISIWLATLAALLGLIALAWYIVRERQLREKYASELAARAEWFRTTLTSIGDAVIATDRSGIVTFLNPVAEKLTGRSLRDASGKPIGQAFPIFSEQTGKRAVDPVEKVIEHGVVVGLANHTVLQHADGSLIAIDDSAAPIRNEKGELIGVVLVFRDITETRRAEKESRLLASIVEWSDDGIISLDTNGIITSWNRGATALFGYSAKEMTGQRISAVYPDDRKDEFPEVLDRIRRGERADHFQSVRRTKEGRLIHVSLSISPLYDAGGEIIGASKIVRDITGQIEAQREIALQRERLQVTLRSIGDGVVATDTEGRVSFLNPIAEQLTGWASGEATGRPINDVMVIINEQSRGPVENPVMRVLREGKVVGFANHTVLIGRDGSELAIDDSAAPIRDDRGEMIGVVLVFRDITAERRAEEAMRRADKLTAAARLSATVAHEINNPLAALVNLIFIARNTAGIPGDAVQQLEQAEQELERVAHITRQALGFYRETSAPEPLEIADLVNSVLKLYSNKLRAKNITVRRAFEACPPIEGIVGELRQAVSNLVANAIDAVERDGIIMVGAHVVPDGADCMVEIIVADDGPGIASAHINRIFEPFFTTKKDVGTGLGLWAAKTIVDRHGGTISVRSHQDANESRGAAFTIQLPCTSRIEPDKESNMPV